MVRKTKVEAEKTKVAIMRAAEKCFYMQGVVSTSLQKIADVAGVTRGAVYWHFKNKVELLQAIADEAFLPHEELLERLANTDLDKPLEELRKTCLSTFKDMMKDGSSRRIFTILMNRCEYVDEMEALTKRNQECRVQVAERLKVVLKKAKSKKCLAVSWTPQTAAVALQGMFMGFMIAEVDYSCPDPVRDRNYKAAITAFFKALAV